MSECSSTTESNLLSIQYLYWGCSALWSGGRGGNPWPQGDLVVVVDAHIGSFSSQWVSSRSFVLFYYQCHIHNLEINKLCRLKKNNITAWFNLNSWHSAINVKDKSIFASWNCRWSLNIIELRFSWCCTLLNEVYNVPTCATVS